MKKKIAKYASNSWMEHESQRLMKEFSEVGKQLVWQLDQGGGIKNIHIADTIRELDRLYWINATYQKAVKDAKD